MPPARYFLPDQPKLQDVYSKDHLRVLLHKGELRRGDMVVDDETGLAHLLGDLLARPQLTGNAHVEEKETHESQSPAPDEAEAEDNYAEFRADTPLTGAELNEDEANEESESDDESSGEELIRHLRPSWLSYPRLVLFAFACGAAAFYCHREHIGFLYVIALGSVAALFLLYVSFLRSTTDYHITSVRVETESGLIGRNSNEVRICDIRAIDVRMSGFTALFGVGTVEFSSAGGSSVEVQFRNVRNPHRIKQIVRALQG